MITKDQLSSKFSILSILVPLLILASGAGALFYFQNKSVNTEESFRFAVPRGCKNLGILGSTPHPTKYVLEKKGTKSLKNLLLDDFLDVNDLKDSFRKTFAVCQKASIDHLLIAYLPVYFYRLKPYLKEKTERKAYKFFHAIAHQVQKLIEEIKEELKITLPVTLITPSQYLLKHIPDYVSSDAEYARYLIKQFPIINYGRSELEMITIINTQTDDPQQSARVIDYLQYEYLFERKIQYQHYTLEKKQFHSYL